MQIYETEENTPLYQKGEPLQECPKCDYGIIRYNYVMTPEDRLVDYIECDNILCGVYTQIIQPRLF